VQGNEVVDEFTSDCLELLDDYLIHIWSRQLDTNID